MADSRPGTGGDAELVRRAVAGDRGAYEELVTRYQGHVYGLAYSLVGDWAEAQDIAQETFIRVYANLEQLRDPARFAPWLRRVTFSVTMNWLRAYRPQAFEQLDGRVDLDRLEIPDFRPGPAEVAEKRELARAVMSAVASLPSEYRVPLTMFHLDGLSYRKVADFLDIPLGTAKSLIHRARERLRESLGAYVTEEMTPMVKEVFDEHRLPAEFAHNLIDGLEAARWGAGQKENSVIGALEAALRAMGEEVPYEFLMGISGGAFRLQMQQPNWCPSAPHANCGFRLYDTLAAALPWELAPVDGEQGPADGRPRAPQALLESIDHGVPGFYSKEEESLVVGYEQEGERVLLRPYAARAEGYTPVAVADLLSSWGGFEVLRRKPSPPERRATLVHSLEIAVELAHASAFGKYASGFAAYEFWIAGLRDASRFEEPKQLPQEMHANAHCYYSLVDARGAAAAYLRSIAAEFSGEAGERLARAAQKYEQIDEILHRRRPTEIAPMPWALGEGEVWTQAQREAQAELLEEALAVERAAVSELERALARV